MRTELVCGNCGARSVAGEDFCGECGTYLEWEGVPAAVDEPVFDQPDETTPTTESPRTVVERVKAAVGLGDETPEEIRTKEPASTHDAGPIAEQPAKSEHPVAAVLPGAAAPKPRRRPVVAHEQPIQPGDLICGHCGAGNKPARKFCRRCGKDLVEAETARIPWWRRLLAKRRRPGKTAGSRPKERPGRRRMSRRFILLLVLLGLVVAGGLVVRPHARSWYEAVLDRVRGVNEVNVKGEPVSSLSRPGHDASLASDGHPNTWWSPKGDGRNSTLLFRFDPAIRLVYVSIQPGVTAKDKKLLREVSRPRTIELVLTSRDPKTKERARTTKTLHLDSTLGLDTENVATSNVVRAKFKILSIYEGTMKSRGMAIGEVEFRARK